MRFVAPPPERTVEPGPRPTFSIVIPAYQAASTIADAVSSALAQTCAAHEVIVVDDGSTDDLEGALAPFKDRITLVRKNNGGKSSALNEGLAAASGEFLAILDADDVYRERRLEAMGDLAAARPDLDILTTETEIVLEGLPVGRFNAGTPFVAVGQRTAIMDRCFIIGESAARIARLRAIGGFDETLPIAHDWDCWVRLVLDGSLAGFVDEPQLEYRLQPDSLTANRVTSLGDRGRVLEQAARNPSLRPSERPALTRALRYHRTRAVLAEAEETLATGTATRRRFLRHAGSAPLSLRARVIVALAAVAPRLARKRIPHDAGPLVQRLSSRPGAESGTGNVATR